MKIKTCELVGLPLDWATGMALGYELRMQGASDTLQEWLVVVHRPVGAKVWTERWSPSTDWRQAGPLVDLYWKRLSRPIQKWAGADPHKGLSKLKWWAWMSQKDEPKLVWLMRAVVALELGEEVDVPPRVLEEGEES